MSPEKQKRRDAALKGWARRKQNALDVQVYDAQRAEAKKEVERLSKLGVEAHLIGNLCIVASHKVPQGTMMVQQSNGSQSHDSAKHSMSIWLVIDEICAGHIIGVFTDESLARQRVNDGRKSHGLVDDDEDNLGWAIVSYACPPDRPNHFVLASKERV